MVLMGQLLSIPKILSPTAGTQVRPLLVFSPHLLVTQEFPRLVAVDLSLQITRGIPPQEVQPLLLLTAPMELIAQVIQ